MPSGRRPASARGGRRPGESGTREAILAAARAAFGERGYDRTTIRVVAAAAGVDPALVIHYFRSKDGLFEAALELPVEPRKILARADIAPQNVGATIVRTFLQAWESPEARLRLLVLLRSALTNAKAMGMVRDLLVREVFAPVTEALGSPDAPLRATLAGSQFVGLAIMRYVGRIEPMASASVDDLVAAVGPTIQRYLTGDLGGAGDARAGAGDALAGGGTAVAEGDSAAKHEPTRGHRDGAGTRARSQDPA